MAGAIERADGRDAVDGELLDLGVMRIGFAGAAAEGEDTAATLAAVEAADVVVFATPVYRGSMTGTLKNLIDLIPVSALKGKVVGLVAMGASDHHFVGAERHLRDVLAFFGAVVLPVAVYLTAADFADGAPGERAVADLDALYESAVAISRAIAGEPLGPPPLGR
jgi:FMN reductase